MICILFSLSCIYYSSPSFRDSRACVRINVLTTFSTLLFSFSLSALVAVIFVPVPLPDPVPVLVILVSHPEGD